MAGLGDTIAACSSPPGWSARALIRVSGPDVMGVVAALLRPARSESGAFITRIDLGEGVDLPALAILFRAPRSYTGEDGLELQIPGNPHLVERVLGRLCAEAGVRPAAPGEFTARAFLNGRLSIEQAEGVALTIAARNDAELAAAARLRSGAQGEAYRRLADDLTGALALVEAGMDFSDQEDVVPIAPAQLTERLDGMIAALESMGASGAAQSGGEARVALVGAPNAGKSTLFNALLGRARAVVSEEAGTTRDVIVEPLDLSRDLPGAAPALLMDLAGLDEALGARSAADRASQDAARRAIESADALILCDPSGRFDVPVWIDVGGRPVVRVRTKADLPGGGSGGEGLAVCALDGWNLGALRRAIADAAEAGPGGGAAEAALLPRHRRALDAALGWLREARACAADEGARMVWRRMRCARHWTRWGRWRGPCRRMM
ncbi:MAG: GTPase [Planctomycetota bacterium]|nr:GTPase [Planctomycetota bacterium]